MGLLTVGNVMGARLAACIFPVIEWRDSNPQPPVLEFGNGDNLTYDPVPTRPINWPVSSTGLFPDANLSCRVLSRWVAKW